MSFGAQNWPETIGNDQKVVIILKIFSADAAKLWRPSGKNGRRVLTLQRQLVIAVSVYIYTHTDINIRLYLFGFLIRI